MKEIRIAQISLNMGAGKEEEKLKKSLKLLQKIANMTAVKTVTKKRIPGWGLRPGLAVGGRVTIRRNKEEMLKRLLAARGNTLAKKKFDSQGNFSFGIPEYIDIPGMDYDPELKIMGLDVAVTLERAGFRLKKRKIQPKKIGRSHRITKEEAIEFIQKTFETKIE